MTKSISRRQCIAAVAAPAALLVLAGCATTGGTAPLQPADEQAALIKRAQTYWDLVRANDNIGSWPYEEASKDPKASLEDYLKRGGVVYDAVEVRGVRSMEGDRAVLNVWMRYSLPLLRVKRQESMLEDEWHRIDGVWHHVLRKSVMFRKEAD